MKKVIPFLLLIVIVFGLTGCETNQNNKDTDTNKDNALTETNKENQVNMKIIIDDKEYEVELFDSITKDEILSQRPLDLTLSRYAGHEYYAELPSKPTMDSNTTSNILAGHIYYWDGWNAFVINYEDYDISPYKVVHIGEIKDKSIIEYLENADNEINVKLEVGE